MNFGVDTAAEIKVYYELTSGPESEATPKKYGCRHHEIKTLASS